MGRKPLGKEIKVIGINMKKEISDELERRAKSMHISVGAYCKIIFQNWIEADNKLTLQEK